MMADDGDIFEKFTRQRSEESFPQRWLPTLSAFWQKQDGLIRKQKYNT